MGWINIRNRIGAASLTSPAAVRVSPPGERNIWSLWRLRAFRKLSSVCQEISCGLWESHLRSARRLKDLKRLRAADEAPSSPPASFPRLLSPPLASSAPRSSTREAAGWVLIHVIWRFCLPHSRYRLHEHQNTRLCLASCWNRILTDSAGKSVEMKKFGLFTKTDACARLEMDPDFVIWRNQTCVQWFSHLLCLCFTVKLINTFIIITPPPQKSQMFL